MRSWIHLELDTPIRISRFKLDEQKAEQFNNGDYARTNYKYLYRLKIDKGEGKTYIEVATPDFKQTIYSVKTLWNSYEGKPYDRHNHPVVMQAFDIDKKPLETTDKDKIDKFQSVLKKNTNG